MTKKIGDKKVTGVGSTKASKDIEETKGVGTVTGVKATTSVSSVGGVGGIGKRRSTRVMSLAEREEIFKMVDHEAKKLFGDQGLSPQKRKLVEDAVKMAIDTGLVGEGKPKK